MPEQFEASTASALKDYGLNWSYFNILSALVGAKGIKADSDVAIFPNVDVRSELQDAFKAFHSYRCVWIH